jgi:hypothetical protein
LPWLEPLTALLAHKRSNFHLMLLEVELVGHSLVRHWRGHGAEMWVVEELKKAKEHLECTELTFG